MFQNKFSRSFNPMSPNMYADYMDMADNKQAKRMAMSKYANQPPSGRPVPPQRPTVPDRTTPPQPEPIPLPGADKGYLQNVLNRYIGEQVRVEFLIGTSIIVDKAGTLLEVGINYIILQPPETDDLLICDLYSIKFVTVFR
ncbi:hypothetical protein [Anaeromicrobium sediminis]|uniref:Spore coat protein GerQ n=1 Tax=Anaeromicrobium sediminis TaxID=1478221 RepID=A0A267MNY5_9FIRM|nr:hypothetical protein [Anaeromicrobium sediminis]PAB60628.1 hypothetical protein CCE28_03550 [Anaeromicrobium sediminis]